MNVILTVAGLAISLALSAPNSKATEQPVFQVKFETNSHVLDTDDKDQIEVAYQCHLAARPLGLTNGKIVVIGYAGGNDDSKTAIEVSEQRAIAVADYFVEIGAPKEWIAVDWKGKSQVASSRKSPLNAHFAIVEIWP